MKISGFPIAYFLLDAATFKGNSTSKVLIEGGGARNAKDKTFQHNGGGSVDIKCFQCQTCGKVYRACGTCGKLKRTVSLTDVKVTNITSAVVAINPSNGDKATIRRITIVKPFTKYTCARSETGLNGAEPKFLGDGPDGKSCLYTKADIIYV